MMIKNRLLPVFFTFFTLTGLQAEVLFTQEQVSALIEEALKNARNGNKLSFFKIGSMKDFGTWMWQSKTGAIKAAALVVGVCVLKRYFKSEQSTRAQEVLEEARRLHPHLNIQNNAPNNNTNDNIVGKAMDKIGGFGLSAGRLALTAANNTAWYIYNLVK